MCMRKVASKSPAIYRLLDWKDSEKCLLLSVLLFIYMSFYLVWHLVTAFFTDFGAQYVSPAGAGQLSWVLLFNLSGYLLLIFWASLLRKSRRQSPLFVHSFVQFFGVSFLLLGLMFGLYSPITGMVLLGSPLVGFILFGFRPVIWGFTVSTVMVLLLSWLAARGHDIYALYFRSDPAAKGSLSYYWIASTVAFSVPFVAGVLTLVSLLLRRWVYREAQVRAMAVQDPLTGLSNRRALFDQFAHEMARARRSGEALSVCVMDLDHFKQINDRHGHAAGDAVLVRVAELLRECLRETDRIGRIGGEEFVLVLPDTGHEGAKKVIERCRVALVGTPVMLDVGDSLTVSASFGVVTALAGEHATESQLVSRADDALYLAKQRGRNRVEFWSSAMLEVATA